MKVLLWMLMLVKWVHFDLLRFNVKLEALISLIELIGIESFASINECQVDSVNEIVSKYRSIMGKRLERLGMLQEIAASSSGHGGRNEEDQENVHEKQEADHTGDYGGRERTVEDIEVPKENPNGEDDQEHASYEKIEIRQENVQREVDHAEEKGREKGEILEGLKENPSGGDDQEREESSEKIESRQENVQWGVDHGEEKDRENEIFEGLKENPSGEDDQEHKLFEKIEVRQESMQREVDHGKEKKGEKGEIFEGLNETPNGEGNKQWILVMDRRKRSKENPRKRVEIVHQDANLEVDGRGKDEVRKGIEGFKENPNGEGEKEDLGVNVVQESGEIDAENRGENPKQEVDGGNVENVEERLRQEEEVGYDPREQHLPAYSVDHPKIPKKRSKKKRKKTKNPSTSLDFQDEDFQCWIL